MLIEPFGFLAGSSTVCRLLRIGQFYQGGYVVYLTGSYPNQGGLIVAPVEISSALAWPAIGGQVTPVEQAYGYGFSNTESAYSLGYTTGGIAACWNYSVNGYSDWFMPSTIELIYTIQQQSKIPYTLNAAAYHASSAYGPNPANDNFAITVAPNPGITTVAHSTALGILACRYITPC
jgi:hypothetical protein